MRLKTKKKFLRTIIICSFFVFIASSLIAQNSDKKEDFFSPINRMRFGNYLYAEKDYLRALDEFKEYLTYADNDTVRYKFADCYLKIGRYEEAADKFKSLFYKSDLSDDAMIGYYKSVFLDKKYSQIRDYIIFNTYMPYSNTNDIKRLGLITHLFDNSILPDTNKFFPAFADSNKNSVRKFYFLKKVSKKKNPTTAALYSAIIPGAGKIYTGDIGDGITAFIATGLLTFLSINNFNHDHQFRGWLFAGLASLAYAGNIYGSAASAQIYNAKNKYNYDEAVQQYFEKRNYLLPEDNSLK